MHKQGTVVYEMEMRYTKVSRNTGKEYKVWHFIAMSPIMENLDICKSYRKGKYLMVETADGLVRYNMETEYTVDYGTPEEEDAHEQFEEGIEVVTPENLLERMNPEISRDLVDTLEPEAEPSEIVKWLVHNIRTTGEASALCQSEANEAMAICSELKTKCEYNGQGRFIITVSKEEPTTAFKLFYDVSYDSVTICENQSEIVTANSFDEAKHILIKRLEILQSDVEVFIHSGHEMKELTHRIKRDMLEQRLHALKRVMGLSSNMEEYIELSSEYNKVQDQITQLMGVK